MRLDLYLAETRRLAQKQGDLLDTVEATLGAGNSLNSLEQNGALHALQLLIENAIGKCKHLLKAAGKPVPVSTYDTVQALAELGILGQEQLKEWNAIIGLRNRIVHEYLGLDIERVLQFIQEKRHHRVVEFLQAPLPENLGQRPAR